MRTPMYPCYPVHRNHIGRIDMEQLVEALEIMDDNGFMIYTAKAMRQLMKETDQLNQSTTAREWVSLTDEERIAALFDKDGMTLDYEDYAEAIEAKLKEKNA